MAAPFIPAVIKFITSSGVRAATKKFGKEAVEVARKKMAKKANKEAVERIRAVDVRKSVQKSASKTTKDGGSKRVIGKKDTRPPLTSQSDKIAQDLEKMPLRARQAIFSKIKKGEPSKYTDAAKKYFGITATKKVGGKMNKKGYGGKMTKKSAGGAAGAAMQYKEAQRKRRVQAAKDLGPKVLKKGGTPKGVGCATRGYGKAMK